MFGLDFVANGYENIVVCHISLFLRIETCFWRLVE